MGRLHKPVGGAEAAAILRDAREAMTLAAIRAERQKGASSVTKPPPLEGDTGVPPNAPKKSNDSDRLQDGFRNTRDRGGRPRRHSTPAAKQRAYRERKRRAQSRAKRPKA